MIGKWLFNCFQQCSGVKIVLQMNPMKFWLLGRNTFWYQYLIFVLIPGELLALLFPAVFSFKLAGLHFSLYLDSLPNRLSPYLLDEHSLSKHTLGWQQPRLLSIWLTWYKTTTPKLEQEWKEFTIIRSVAPKVEPPFHESELNKRRSSLSCTQWWHIFSNR